MSPSFWKNKALVHVSLGVQIGFVRYSAYLWPAKHGEYPWRAWDKQSEMLCQQRAMERYLKADCCHPCLMDVSLGCR